MTCNQTFPVSELVGHLWYLGAKPAGYDKVELHGGLKAYRLDFQVCCKADKIEHRYTNDPKFQHWLKVMLRMFSVRTINEGGFFGDYTFDAGFMIDSKVRVT